MGNSLIGLGVVCILAAIVGGGLSALGTQLPAIPSLRRQGAVFIFGLLLILAGVFANLPPKPISKSPKSISTPAIVAIEKKKYLGNVAVLRIAPTYADIEYRNDDDMPVEVIGSFLSWSSDGSLPIGIPSNDKEGSFTLIVPNKLPTLIAAHETKVMRLKSMDPIIIPQQQWKNVKNCGVFVVISGNIMEEPFKCGLLNYSELGDI